MPNTIFTKKNIVGAIVVVVFITAVGFFFFGLDPVVASSGSLMVFQINSGDGFRKVAQDLYDDHLVRSPVAFDIFSLVDGRAFTLKPGLYKLSPSMDTPQILAAISGGGAGQATVTIPEGSNVFDIDRILSNALVIHPGALIGAKGTANIEGHLFPDTYQFYTSTTAGDVIREMEGDFNAKAAPLFARRPGECHSNPYHRLYRRERGAGPK